MEPRISLEHIGIYRSEIDVIFTIHTDTGLTDTRCITLNRHQSPGISDSTIQPILQNAFALLCEQLQQLHHDLEAQTPFADNILWTYDVLNPSSD